MVQQKPWGRLKDKQTAMIVIDARRLDSIEGRDKAIEHLVAHDMGGAWKQWS